MLELKGQILSVSVLIPEILFGSYIMYCFPLITF